VRDVLALLGIPEGSALYETTLKELSKHARLYEGSVALHTVDKIVTKCREYQRTHADVMAAVVIQKYIRMLRAYHEYVHLRDPTLHARRALFTTLITDEKAYVYKLNTIVSDYLRPLREHVQGKERLKGQPPLLTQQDLHAIFGNIDALLLLHTELQRDFDYLFRTTSLEVVAVNKLFVRTALKLRQLYTVYVHNFTRSVRTLELLRTTPNPRSPTLTFESLLHTLQLNSRMPDLPLSTFSLFLSHSLTHTLSLVCGESCAYVSPPLIPPLIHTQQQRC
jgi:hypothetical protein